MALRRLGYSDKQTKAIEEFVMGTKSLNGWPNPAYETLESLGFTSAQIKYRINYLRCFDINRFLTKYSAKNVYKITRND